jgi:tetratricopeptide (TPR) repeat protein
MFLRTMFLPWVVVLVAGTAPAGPAMIAFERGEQDLAANRLDEAARAYRQAIAARPNYAEAINGLGSVFFKQGKKDEAIAQFKAAIGADPTFKLAYFNLGYAARKSNDFATASRAYEKYTELEPDDPDGFYGLGESYRQLGQRAKAVAAYQRFIAKETRPGEQKWVDRAKEYRALLNSGAEDFSSIAPPSAPQFAAAGLAQGPAAAGGAPAASGSPEAAMASHQIAEGDRLMEEKKYRPASFAYLDAVKSDANSIEALFKLGNAFAVLGYYTHAIVNWNKVIQLTNDAAIRKTAEDNIALAKKKMVEVSIGPLQLPAAAKPVIPIDPLRGQARAAYEQGVRQINERDYAGALQSLTEAIQLQPGFATAHIARGSANMGIQRYPDAVADYQTALRLDGNLAAPLYGLGEAFQAMGRTADARQYFERYAASTSADARPDLQREARQKADKLR